MKTMEKRFTSFDPKKVSELVYNFLKEKGITQIEIVLVTPEKGEIREEKNTVPLVNVANELYYYLTTECGKEFHLEAKECTFSYDYCVGQLEIRYPYKMKNEFKKWTEGELMGEWKT